MAHMIGITGYAGSGKDTLACMLADKLEAKGKTVEILSFAGIIHDICDGVGLDSNTRETKEKEVTLLFSDFEEVLMQEIDIHLAGAATMDERCELFAFFIDALVRRGHLHYGPAGNTLRISPRVFMQLLGTEGGRRVDPEFWVRMTVALATDVDYAIVPDVRFPNEFAAMDSMWARDGYDDRVAEHASEAYVASLMAQADVRLTRCATLSDLANLIDSVLNTLGI